MTPTYLTAATIRLADRARFHLTWAYLLDDHPTGFAGAWIALDGSAPDGKCGLYLDLVRREGGAVAVALVADRTDVHGTEILAAWAALNPATWPQQVAPTVAAHPRVGRTVTEWEEDKPLLNRWQRALLAWAIVGL